MQINPEAGTFGEVTDLNQETEEFKAKLTEMMQEGEIVAIGPKEHLQALKLDLLRVGYKSMK